MAAAYAYADDDPLSATDPTGRWTGILSPAQAIALGGVLIARGALAVPSGLPFPTAISMALQISLRSGWGNDQGLFTIGVQLVAVGVQAQLHFGLVFAKIDYTNVYPTYGPIRIVFIWDIQAEAFW